MDAADVATLVDDGLRGELAHLELGTLCIVFRFWLLVSNGGVPVAWEYRASSRGVLESVGPREDRRADPYYVQVNVGAVLLLERYATLPLSVALLGDKDHLLDE
jgi:hypothetical protein